MSERFVAMKNLPLIAFSAVCLLPIAGCTTHEEGFTPVGDVIESPVEQARYVRRLHLDLTGEQPSDEAVSAALSTLETSGNTPSVRGSLADELIASPAFGALFTSDLASRAFGSSVEDMYALFCPIIQSVDAACAACEPTADCSGCECPSLTSLAAERQALLDAPTDLTAYAATTSEIERRFAGAQVYVFSATTADSVATALFDDFLGRPIDPDELRNASAMVTGTLIPETPAGLLFHRHGQDYADLIDIVMTSEVYRDAAVDAVFLRTLGRSATPSERYAFSKTLDPVAPDIRPLLRAILSSEEYFKQ